MGIGGWLERCRLGVVFFGREDAELCGRRVGVAEVRVRAFGSDTPPWRALKQAVLNQVRLVDLFQGGGVLTDGGRERAETYRPPRELDDHRL